MRPTWPSVATSTRAHDATVSLVRCVEKRSASLEQLSSSALTSSVVLSPSPRLARR
jgi:hypothetical protein